MPAYVSRSRLTRKKIDENIARFKLDDIPLPPSPAADWPRVIYTYRLLLRKILEYGPKDQLVLIDYYIALLLLTRAAVESGRWPT